jgi:cysteine desulfurase/selenocysteine lyase
VTFDSAAIRRQFPIFEVPATGGTALHYLDSAATAQMPNAVLDAVRTHDASARGNIKRGVHFMAERATEAYGGAREKVAGFLNASPSEVVFTSGTTAAINLVAHAFGQSLKAGDEVVVSELEHHSNMVPWQMLRDRSGIILKYLPVTSDGRLDLETLEATVTDKCKLIAVTHVSNVTGAVTNVSAIVAAAGAVGAKVFLDGAQRAPHGPVNVAALGVDFYAMSSHKMFGPSGAGVLWGRAELLADMPPFLGGGEMIRSVTKDVTTFADPPARFEAGTPPITQVVGMGAAIDWIGTLDHEAVTTHLNRLTERVLNGIADLNGSNGRIKVVGPQGLQERYPVISFEIDGAHPHDICQILDGHGVALRGGHHCAQVFMDAMDLAGTSRASLGPYSDDSDVDALLAGVEDAFARLGVQ